jgi:hypothetical protein
MGVPGGAAHVRPYGGAAHVRPYGGGSTAVTVHCFDRVTNRFTDSEFNVAIMAGRRLSRPSAPGCTGAGPRQRATAN